MTTTKTIRPGAELDFLVDWDAPPAERGPWLAAGETISSYSVQVEGPITKLSDSVAAGEVTAWVRCDPTAREGARAGVVVAIVTSLGRKDSRTVEIVVTR